MRTSRFENFMQSAVFNNKATVAELKGVCGNPVSDIL